MTLKRLKRTLNTVIFGTSTKAGKRFDIVLLWLILFSIINVSVESIPEMQAKYGYQTFRIVDWIFIGIFSVEYILRILITEKKFKYIFSYWGIIDFISIIPSYIALFVTGYQFILMIRILRLLRIFRILRLFEFMSEGQVLAKAMRASARKIIIFMCFIFTIVVLLGTLMYVIEHDNPGFRSIPSSIYWGIVTITTVGFGDIVPLTALGKMISSFIMLTGYSIIAVPTGIMTAEFARLAYKDDDLNKVRCDNCAHISEFNSNFCSKCGESLLEEKLSED
jgi:voltage-gated potassium channel